MKIPPWVWLVLLFILPIFAWIAIGFAASKANIQRILLPNSAHAVQISK